MSNQISDATVCPLHPSQMDRQRSKQRLVEQREPWDVVVIGGGATGIATALDAATRGLSVALLERYDFGKGTSSRSTKLVHGGVRYLRQGNLTLVKDALRERELLKQNATALVSDLAFVIPCQSRLEQWYYAIGLKLYDWLAGKSSFGRSRRISSQSAEQLLGAVRPNKRIRGVVYHDGQFDDAKLLFAMARTATSMQACLMNYAAVMGFDTDEQGRLVAATVADQETGELLAVRGRCFVNAAGPFCDEVRKLDQPNAESLLKVSQGVHIVVAGRFFPSSVALIVPKTDDGRVLFIIPWRGYVLIGTTDTEIERPLAEPSATDDELHFLLDTAAKYLVEPPQVTDVLSIFTGIRPLVKNDRSAQTASLSRDHVIRVSSSGLITITGGKWTTVRKMAEDCVDRVQQLLASQAPQKQSQTSVANSRTKHLKLWTEGCQEPDQQTVTQQFVVAAAREEMARTVEDVLARRSRILFCDARLAIQQAPDVARWLAEELGRTDPWQDEQVRQFTLLAQNYLPA